MLRRTHLALLVCLALPAVAQTYTPKTIRFEGAQSQDSAQLLALTGWKIGAPITQEQIQAGLQKLADTGSFTDLNWHADANALVITLVSSPDGQELPVRFANFAWWTPSDLERQVEARVPLYHGELALTGSLLDQVKSALVAIAREKNLAIKVEAARSGSAGHNGAVVLSIASPDILIGNVFMEDVKPAFGPSTASFIQGMKDQAFDVPGTSDTITHDGADIFRNAGYLDAVVDPPKYSEPRAEEASFAIDATVTVHRGELYRVAAMNFTPASPLSESDLRRLSELRPGDPASPMGLLISAQKIARAYQNLGYLDADAHKSATIDNIAHTASYAIAAEPGELYHMARVDASAAPADVQEALAHEKRIAPGAVPTLESQLAVRQILQSHNAKDFALGVRRDRASHTVTYFILRKGAGGIRLPKDTDN